MFEKKTIINNIYYLTKQKNIKIGDLEKEAKVSTGYFSRLAKDDNSSVPSIETMYIVSKILNVSLDVLIKYEFDMLSETEKYIVKFLDKLINDTTKNKVPWQSENYKEVTYNWIKGGKDLNSGHPLLIVEVDDFNRKDVEGRELKYYSLFTDKILELNNDIFSFDSPNARFYLAKVEYVFNINSLTLTKKIEHQYELYAIINGSRKKICNATSETNSVINKLMIDLYNIVSNYCKKPKIDKDVKNAIDVFIYGF